MKYYIKKGVKIISGYGNSAIYDFNSGVVYIVNLNMGNSLTVGDMESLSNDLKRKLLQCHILTNDSRELESNPVAFTYDLFDDKYSYKKCKLCYMEVTDVCNFHCIHCYANIQRNANSFLSIADAELFIQKIAQEGPCDIRVTGGEPFLNPNIIEIINVINERIIPVTKHSIVSNGTFDIKKAIHVLEKGFELQISIYGNDDDDYKSFANAANGCYQKVEKNLQELSNSKYKDQIVLLFSVNAKTHPSVATFVDKANKLGFRYILNRPASVGRAVMNNSQLSMDDASFIEFAKSQKPSKPFFCYHLCQLYWTSVMVSGDVTPCGFLRSEEFTMGNLQKQSFAEVWNSDKYKCFRKHSANDVIKCRNCEFKWLCTAGCCGETYAYSGNLFNCYPWCKIKPYVNKDYLKLNDNELYQVDKVAAGIFEFTER